MSRYVITKDLGYFAASHNLPDHDGGCYNLHGHNYGVKVSIAGLPNSTQGAAYSGMIIDFTHIKDIYKEKVHALVDHAHILGTKLPQWYVRFVDLLSKSELGNRDVDAQSEVDKLLGKVAHLPIEDTTAENLAKWIYDVMQSGLDEFLEKNSVQYLERPRIYSVSLTETETSIAEYVG